MDKDFENFIKDLEKSGRLEEIANKVARSEDREQEVKKEIISMLKIQRDTIYGMSQEIYLRIMISNEWVGEDIDTFERQMKLMERLTFIIEKMEREQLREEGA